MATARHPAAALGRFYGYLLNDLEVEAPRLQVDRTLDACLRDPLRQH